MYCLGCKNYTHNFRPQKVKMTNKVLREKSNCVICQSNKSRFLKQKHNNKNNFNDPIKSKNSFYKLKNMHIYCKTVKNTQVTRFQKNLSYFKEQNQRKIKMCYLFD